MRDERESHEEERLEARGNPVWRQLLLYHRGHRRVMELGVEALGISAARSSGGEGAAAGRQGRTLGCWGAS